MTVTTNDRVAPATLRETVIVAGEADEISVPNPSGLKVKKLGVVPLKVYVTFVGSAVVVPVISVPLQIGLISKLVMLPPEDKNRNRYPSNDPAQLAGFSPEVAFDCARRKPEYKTRVAESTACREVKSP